MEAIWNHMQLERPPNATCHVENQKFDATKFLLMLDKVIKDLTCQELLHKEAAILSRLIYRMKSKFRNDKGAKSMSKLNKALLKYLSLSLQKEYKNLKNYVEVNTKYTTLPSKQMIEYVLVKTQGFAKLMLRIEEVSKYSAHFLKCRIGLGHAWCIAVIAYAVVSRIWYLIKNSCIWYNKLYQYLNLFEVVGVSWLPKDYEFANDLKSWLSIPWIDEPIPSVPSSYGLKNIMFKLITPRGYDSDENVIIDIQDYSRKTKSENAFPHMEDQSIVHSSLSNQSENVISNDDRGEIIDRRTFNLKYIPNTPISSKKGHGTFTKTEDTKEKTINIPDNKQKLYSTNTGNVSIIRKKHKNDQIKKKLITFDDANNTSDLLILLNNESYPGLDKLRWNMIRNKSKKLLEKLEICSDKKKQTVLFQKTMKRIRNWIV
ncbi:PREDICTED: uncharacterized protein LOC108547746 [Eufriesea mexicana]|uniref:uncharacterized protein LOC108547746 n=1 Tax=Eufriesea mexicana TaxID=516756 RepID=UPI00083C44FC|nr:PREDICTED: uncharacterized protein LOC108547746 [Eufriesea mexicana]